MTVCDRMVRCVQISAIRPFWLATEADILSPSPFPPGVSERDLLDHLPVDNGKTRWAHLSSPLATIIVPVDVLCSGEALSGEYGVSLVSRQLGMTIENVFERTIVRSVHPNSEAHKLNVKANSVILNIGSASTRHQTHLETLEALKNTVRPVKLRMCQVEEQVQALWGSRLRISHGCCAGPGGLSGGHAVSGAAPEGLLGTTV